MKSPSPNPFHDNLGLFRVTLVTPELRGHGEPCHDKPREIIGKAFFLGEKFTYYVYPTVPGFFGGGSGQLQLATGGYVISLRGSTPQAVAPAAMRAWARTLDFLRKG